MVLGGGGTAALDELLALIGQCDSMQFYHTKSLLLLGFDLSPKRWLLHTAILYWSGLLIPLHILLHPCVCKVSQALRLVPLLQLLGWSQLQYVYIPHLITVQTQSMMQINNIRFLINWVLSNRSRLFYMCTGQSKHASFTSNSPNQTSPNRCACLGCFTGYRSLGWTPDSSNINVQMHDRALLGF